MRTKKKKESWFSGKTFIVTGGSSGIGLAMCKQFAHEGAKLIAISHNPKEFPIAQSQLEPNQTAIEFVKCDITSSTDRENLKKFLTETNISLTGIINCAGISTFGPFFETPTTDIQKNLEVNFTGTILFIRDLFPLVLANDETSTKYLGFMSSTSAKAPMALIGGYPVTKAGVEMFLRTLDLEQLKNVKILSIRAGPVKTNFYSNSISAPGFNIKKLEKYGERMFLIPEKVASVYVKAIKKKKTGIIYASFSAKMIVALTNRKGTGKFMAKGLKMLNER